MNPLDMIAQIYGAGDGDGQPLPRASEDSPKQN